MIILKFLPVEGRLKFVLYMVPYLVVGYDILRKAFKGILNKQVFDENFLMAVATIGAIALGNYKEGVSVMLFYQVGELFQSYAVNRSRQSISDLMNICPEYANIEKDGQIEQVDPDDVEVDDIIVVQPGERIPLDGVVVEGESMIDTSALTGESVPRRAAAGDEIISGCVNGSGLLRVRVTKEFDDSTVARILELVENASSKKAKVENFITRFARYYTPVVVIAAVALAFVPPIVLGGEFGEWIQRACIFLVISCPCALVISVPLSFFGGIGAASRIGVLVKGSNYLEAVSELDTVVFDKTGTLTKGEFKVTELHPAGISEDELLELAAYAENYSTHPIAESIREAYRERKGSLAEAETQKANAGTAEIVLDADNDTIKEVQSKEGVQGVVRKPLIDLTRIGETNEISGHGIETTIDGHKVLAGNGRLMKSKNIPYQECDGIGTVIYLAKDGKFAGSILIADTIKPETEDAIRGLKAAGIRRTVMLTGDRKAVGEAVAAKVGIDQAYTELLPADKVQKVEEMLAEMTGKRKLAFVGDGINDAPVLSRADVGIAMGSMGSDAAIEAADIVLMDDNPAKIAGVVKIGRKTMAIAHQNIVFALAVKAVVLLMGAAGVANMWEAVFADVGVSVIAILNAMRALRTK
jgi:Cd2+/Zn2+-exporting ATPase